MPDAAPVLQALGDPTRRAIVEKLGNGPLAVSSIAAPMAMTLTAVAQHLQVLEKCGLVQTEKIGRVRTCRLDPKGLDVLGAWVRERRSALEASLDRLGALLAEDDD